MPEELDGAAQRYLSEHRRVHREIAAEADEGTDLVAGGPAQVSRESRVQSCGSGTYHVYAPRARRSLLLPPKLFLMPRQTSAEVSCFLANVAGSVGVVGLGSGVGF